MSISYCFELSRSIPLPNIVTNFLLKCSPTHGAFFSTHICDTILAGNLFVSSLSPTHAQCFSPLLTLQKDPYHVPKLETHLALPDKGFASFQDVLHFINVCKWFLASFWHPSYYSSNITFQGLSFIEDRITASNMAAWWQDPTIQAAPASYQILDLMHNLFATLSAT